jgi:hypothetical protein
MKTAVKLMRTNSSKNSSRTDYLVQQLKICGHFSEDFFVIFEVSSSFVWNNQMISALLRYMHFGRPLAL